MLSLVAIGFNLIFSTTKVFHVALGAFYVGGSYIFEAMHNHIHALSVGIPFAILCALGTCIMLAVLIDWWIYQPLANRKSSQAITLIASMAVYLFMVNVISILWGNETQSLVFPSPILCNLFPTYLAPVQQLQLITCLLVLSVVLMLGKSNFFLKVRALSSNAVIAGVIGINTKWIRLMATALGTTLVVVASILRLYDTGVDPDMGLGVTLSASVAAVIGGNNSLSGTVLSAILISLLTNLSAWLFSASWTEGITFFLLIVVILWRTEGLISYKLRVEEK